MEELCTRDHYSEILQFVNPKFQLSDDGFATIHQILLPLFSQLSIQPDSASLNLFFQKSIPSFIQQNILKELPKSECKSIDDLKIFIFKYCLAGICEEGMHEAEKDYQTTLDGYWILKGIYNSPSLYLMFGQWCHPTIDWDNYTVREIYSTVFANDSLSFSAELILQNYWNNIRAKIPQFSPSVIDNLSQRYGKIQPSANLFQALRQYKNLFIQTILRACNNKFDLLTLRSIFEKLESVTQVGSS